MISVVNRIYVNPDFAELFEERFTHRTSLMDGVQGFISFQLMRPLQKETPYLVQTFWESRDAFQGWTSSDSFRKSHAQSSRLPKEAFTGRNQIEIHEIIHEYS
jgi:heme-degrading monooxygenase HmoA